VSFPASQVGFQWVKNGDRERRMRCWARPDLHSPDLRSHGLAVEDMIGEVREKKKKKKRKKKKKKKKKKENQCWDVREGEEEEKSWVFCSHFKILYFFLKL
jgi:hypothetical protein